MLIAISGTAQLRSVKDQLEDFRHNSVKLRRSQPEGKNTGQKTVLSFSPVVKSTKLSVSKKEKKKSFVGRREGLRVLKLCHLGFNPVLCLLPPDSVVKHLPFRDLCVTSFSPELLFHGKCDHGFVYALCGNFFFWIFCSLRNKIFIVSFPRLSYAFLDSYGVIIAFTSLCHLYSISTKKVLGNFVWQKIECQERKKNR